MAYLLSDLQGHDWVDPFPDKLCFLQAKNLYDVQYDLSYTMDCIFSLWEL